MCVCIHINLHKKGWNLVMLNETSCSMFLFTCTTGTIKNPHNFPINPTFMALPHDPPIFASLVLPGVPPPTPQLR